MEVVQILATDVPFPLQLSERPIRWLVGKDYEETNWGHLTEAKITDTGITMNNKAITIGSKVLSFHGEGMEREEKRCLDPQTLAHKFERPTVKTPLDFGTHKRSQDMVSLRPIYSAARVEKMAGVNAINKLKHQYTYSHGVAASHRADQRIGTMFLKTTSSIKEMGPQNCGN